MARYNLFVRLPNKTTPVKIWDGAAVADVFSFGGVDRDFDTAVGWALRNSADCILRDGNATDPTLRAHVLFIRHGVGDYGDGS